LHPIPFHHGVAAFFVIKRHLVLQARTAAFRNLNAQTFPGILRLPFKQAPKLPNRIVRHVNHLCGKYGTGASKSKGCKHGRFRFSSQFVSQKLRFKIA